MKQILYGRGFLKDLQRAKKRGKALTKIEGVIDLLVQEKPLPAKNKNHKLKGEYKDCLECHIEPDWLLIYQKTKDEIILMRTGSHADLFE